MSNNRIANLGGFAHPSKAPQNFSKPPARQTRDNSPKLIGKSLGPKAKDHSPPKRK